MQLEAAHAMAGPRGCPNAQDLGNNIKGVQTMALSKYSAMCVHSVHICCLLMCICVCICIFKKKILLLLYIIL